MKLKASIKVALSSNLKDVKMKIIEKRNTG